jgi:hypothetical protein
MSSSTASLDLIISALEHGIPGLDHLGLRLVHLVLIRELVHDHNPSRRTKDDDGVEVFKMVLRETY